ncbi:MAG: hypothetical protein AAF570_01310 [Bacteroidota bacterium]
MDITGHITYQPLSGGFWGIVAEDGRRFRPVEGVPEEFRKAGMSVKAKVEPADTFSIYMWGTEVHLLEIYAADGD